MKISKVIYFLFGGGILAVLAILIAFYQPSLIEEKELDEKLFPLIKLICTDKSVLDRLIEKQKNHSDKKVYENINSELEKIIYGKY